MIKRADTDQSQLIWIYTVLNKIYLGLTGHGLIISFVENAPFLVLYIIFTENGNDGKIWT